MIYIVHFVQSERMLTYSMANYENIVNLLTNYQICKAFTWLRVTVGCKSIKELKAYLNDEYTKTYRIASVKINRLKEM
jgi:hypothetical protein